MLILELSSEIEIVCFAKIAVIAVFLTPALCSKLWGKSATFGEMPQRLKSMFFKISAKRMDTQSEFFSSKLYVDFSL